MPDLGGADMACSTIARSTRAACDCALSLSRLVCGSPGQALVEKVFRLELSPAMDSRASNTSGSLEQYPNSLRFSLSTRPERDCISEG
jgi:hypothetical protein